MCGERAWHGDTGPALRFVGGRSLHVWQPNHARLHSTTKTHTRLLCGTQAIDGRRLARIENIGKNLLYFWDHADRRQAAKAPPVVVHIRK